eukprot:TRINITY_DN109357_c0_g1_i1.p1 TRINITY_DN109357_c0_g1~~TRINITY_DN109357_c0_g1_i1.p1  ORF type:complete len:314 (-),score=49.81 TRINITY_DN109357_c0_g1_i1:45-986(-)
MCRSSSIKVGHCATSAGALRFLLREATPGSGQREVPLVALPGAAGRAEHVLFKDDGNSPTLLALDWPGSGESTDAWPRWSTQGLAELVQEVLDSFNWQRVIIVGHSLGAMVASHLLVLDKRVVGAVLLAPTPGLLPCVEAGIWPFPLWSVLALLVSAASLCNPLGLHAASQSDLNRAWLLHGLEQQTLHGAGLTAAKQGCCPRPGAPAGLGVWLRRRIGDVAALVAVLGHCMPKLRRSIPVALVWGEKDTLISADASCLSARLWSKQAGSHAVTAVSPDCGHFLQWGAPGLVMSALDHIQREQQTDSGLCAQT